MGSVPPRIRRLLSSSWGLNFFSSPPRSGAPGEARLRVKSKKNVGTLHQKLNPKAREDWAARRRRWNKTAALSTSGRRRRVVHLLLPLRINEPGQAKSVVLGRLHGRWVCVNRKKRQWWSFAYTADVTVWNNHMMNLFFFCCTFIPLLCAFTHHLFHFK